MHFSDMRIGDDDIAYRLLDFQAWYPEDWQERWQRARPLPRSAVPPQGLAIAQVGEHLVQAALAEVLPHFPSEEERAGLQQRSALEVGWTIDHESLRSADVVARKAEQLSQFPALQALLSEAMGVLTGKQTDMEPRLNVSCLLYSQGHGITWHRDRPHCYEAEVYGCVLVNSSDTALEFRESNHKGELTQRYVIEESPGLCFVQRGASRFKWLHGVPEVSHGERLSVTWRWFRPDVKLEY